MNHLGSLLPVKWLPPPREAKYDQQIIVNWLQLEVDPLATSKMPVLNILSGWRNIEVYYYIHDGKDWTARVL